jgi:sugar/nucleoside kinase (ribokinase family)
MNTTQNKLSIIGDVGVDLVIGSIAEWPQIGTEIILPRSELRAGGSAANTALAMRHLGVPVNLVSAVGRDGLGQFLRDQLHGINAHFQVSDSASTISVGIMHECGERNFFTTHGHLDYLSFNYVVAQLERAQSPGSIILLTGPFLLAGLRPKYVDLLKKIKSLGYQIALDTGWPSDGWNDINRELVMQWIPFCDHLLINELEVTCIAAEENLDLAIGVLLSKMKPDATLVAKVGARGVIGLQGGTRIDQPTERAQIFDTIGAGDSFNAGYLAARLMGASLKGSLAFGCKSALLILKRFPRQDILPGEFAVSLSALEPTCGVI